MADVVARWLEALEARHLADLRVQEVTRALRALSSAYVERRHALAGGAALNSTGKRAAFALFYAPLHFIVTNAIVTAVGPGAPATVVDLGCGTGAGGAAWALASESRPRVLGLDRHPWAVDEARWTYAQLGLSGQARVGDAVRFRPPRGNNAIIAAYVLNELPDDARDTVVAMLLRAAADGARVLVLEPIARAVTPWWDDVQARVEQAGGRADEWDLAIERPAIVAKLDVAAGLDHRRVKARSLFIGHSR
jgi:methylase of polypeptide subunit release factors